MLTTETRAALRALADDLPDEAVEAGAAALFGSPGFHTQKERSKALYRRDARAALSAALKEMAR